MHVDKKMERKWEVESAMSTLQRAEEIKKNAALMRDVKKEAKTETVAVKKEKHRLEIQMQRIKMAKYDALHLYSNQKRGR